LQIETAIRLQYVRKVSPQFAPVTIEGTDVVFDADAISFAAHSALWLAHVRCAFNSSHPHREAAKALATWVHRHHDRRCVIDAPTWLELGVRHGPVEPLNAAISDFINRGWLDFPEGETPSLTIPERQPA
jgi:hypothetical protein